MGPTASRIGDVTIEGDTREGGIWRIFKSSLAGLLTVRNYGTESSVLNLWAPPEAVGHSIDGRNREATLSLVRANNSETESEFVDIYNQDYASCGREAGIRIQKRGRTTQYPPFKIEFSDGVKLHEAIKFMPPPDVESDPIIEIKSSVSVLGRRISGLALPENENDAVSKSYVDRRTSITSVYRVTEENFVLAPVVENPFFTVLECDPGHWRGHLRPGFFKFSLNFVFGQNFEDYKNPKHVLLKLDDEVVLCQKIKSEKFASNSVTCGLEVRKSSDLIILFTDVSESTVESAVGMKGFEVYGIQANSFLLEITQILSQT